MSREAREGNNHCGLRCVVQYRRKARSVSIGSGTVRSPHLFFVELIWGGSEMLGQVSNGAQISLDGFGTFAVENEVFAKPLG